jgi:DNA polymerase-1
MNQKFDTEENKRLFLLDAYALIFRAYFAFIRNPRINSKGLNTSAIFGFVNSLEDILFNDNPSHIAVVFDPPGPNFRHKMYPEYKANRESTPEDIKLAIPYIKQIIDAFQIPVVEVPGFEADDVIGTLARMGEEQGFDVFMVTPDKDFTQLVSDHVYMLKPAKGGNKAEVWRKEEVIENFLVEEPAQVIDVLALWGDAADNIPGAPGIGEKTSKKLIKEFGSVENLFLNIDSLKGKQKENIENNKDQIRLSKELVTIDQNVDVPVRDFEKFKRKEVDLKKLSSIFNELEFRTLMQRLRSRYEKGSEVQEAVQTSLFGDDSFNEMQPGSASSGLSDINLVKHNYKLLDTRVLRKEILAKLKEQKEFCFDTETTGLNVLNDEIVGLAFSFEAHVAYYVPVPAGYDRAKSILEEFSEIFGDENIRKIGQNIKYDIHILKNYDIKVSGPLFDTMIAHYLIEPDQRHNLTYLSEVYLQYKPVEIETLIGKKGKGQKSMRNVSLEEIKEYAAEDADLTWQLKEILEKKLKEKALDKLAEKLEMPLIPALVDLERAGVKLDTEALSHFAGILNNEIFNVENEIYDLAGMEFNISSPKQLGEILFERLKVSDGAKKTKTKQYSTSEEVLVKLKDKHEIVAKVLEYRSLKKLVSTYVEALPKLVDKKTGRLHTSFNQAVAATGRLSSANPNLQNIPIREERGREIRKAFIPSGKDYQILSADYSQIELRLMAHLSEDKAMIEAFQQNEDIHTATAAKIYNADKKDVTREMRGRAKTANFGIIYGISSFGLSQRLGISRSDAHALIEGYFITYPGVKEYMNKSIALAREKGYVETIMGRRRNLSDINSRNGVVRSMAERNAINAPIQGSAADIIKLAMIRIYDFMKGKSFKSKMILQVHDELVFDIFIPELDEIKDRVIREMEQVISLKVPLKADYGVGDNWLEAH